MKMFKYCHSVLLGIVLYAIPPGVVDYHYFDGRSLNPDVKEIWPGQIETIKFELRAAANHSPVVIDKLEFWSVGMELVDEVFYGEKKFQANDIMIIEVRVRSKIRGFQCCGIAIFARDQRGKREIAPTGQNTHSYVSHCFFERGAPGARTADSMKIERDNYLKGWGKRPQWSEADLRLAEEEDKIRNGPPTIVPIKYKAGSSKKMSYDEYAHAINGPKKQ